MVGVPEHLCRRKSGAPEKPQMFLDGQRKILRAVACGMVCDFLRCPAVRKPETLAHINDTIRKVAKIFYTLQLKEILDGMNLREISHASVMIIFANAIVLLGAFIFAYQRKGLD